MKSLLTFKTKKEFINRINKLTPQTKPQWGIMNAEQMIRHCALPLELATNKIEIKANKLIAFLFGKRIFKTIMSDVGFKKNLPTFKEAKLPTTKGFEVEKQAIFNLINTFENKNITKKPHPLFGKMTEQQWDVLQTKHIHHHLSQFGV